jgi:hypothetical protein
VIDLSKTYLEKFWNCPACGQKHISALRNTRCPNCASSKVPQDEELFSYEEITDPDGLELAKGAPHWTCSNCGTKNLDKNTHCDGCGNARDESDGVNQIRKINSLPVSSPSPTITDDYSSNSKGDTYQYQIEPQSKVSQFSHVESETKKSKKKLLITLAIITGVILLAALAFLFFHNNIYSGQVIGFNWERSINIEEYKVLSKEGWSIPPFDAYNVFSETRWHHDEPIYEMRTESVYVPGSYTSYTDNGNGSVTAETVDTSHYETRMYQELVWYRPIYQTWYTYKVDRWVYSRSVVTKNDDHQPVWGEYTLRFDSQTVIGAERLGVPSESYVIHFQVVIDNQDPKTYSLSANLNDWNEYILSNTYTLKVNHFGMITNNPLYEDQK